MTKKKAIALFQLQRFGTVFGAVSPEIAPGDLLLN
jgi:hypothetical protein